MNQKNKIKAQEWFKKAKHDISTVEMIIKNGGYSDVASVLLQQAVEKYLKGYLIAQGWRLHKTHNLKDLIDEAVKYNQGFNKFYEITTVLTGYYFEEKYPFDELQVSMEEIKVNFEQSKEIVELIENLLKEAG